MLLHTTRWAALVTACAATLALAGDHADGPAATAQPAADLTSFYAFMEGGRLNLALGVYPRAPAGARFAEDVQYVIHTTSAALATPNTKVATDVICTFATAGADQVISCWAGGSYVTGKVNTLAGVTSADGKLKVFAGPRRDPEVFNPPGFEAARASFLSNASLFTYDAQGCASMTMTTAGLFIELLRSNGQGGSATNPWANQNVLAIVVSVDPTLLTPGGPIVRAWASTRK